MSLNGLNIGAVPFFKRVDALIRFGYVSITVPAAGTSLVIVQEENGDGNAANIPDFTITIQGVAATIVSLDFTALPNLTINIAETIHSGDVVKITYHANSTRYITDAVTLHVLRSFALIIATNNSLVTTTTTSTTSTTTTSTTSTTTSTTSTTTSTTSTTTTPTTTTSTTTTPTTTTTTTLPPTTTTTTTTTAAPTTTTTTAAPTTTTTTTAAPTTTTSTTTEYYDFCETYYFDDYDTGVLEWSSSPFNMVDGNIATDAFTSVDDDVQMLTSNTYAGVPMGAIVSVWIRAYGQTQDGDIALAPLFSSMLGDLHNSGITGTEGWGSWIDITNDTNAPASWTWPDVDTLDCEVLALLSEGGAAYCAKVEVRVCYTYTTTTTTTTTAQPSTTTTLPPTTTTTGTTTAASTTTTGTTTTGTTTTTTSTTTPGDEFDYILSGGCYFRYGATDDGYFAVQKLVGLDWVTIYQVTYEYQVQDFLYLWDDQSFFRIGADDMGFFVVEEYDIDAWVNIYSVQLPITTTLTTTTTTTLQ